MNINRFFLWGLLGFASFCFAEKQSLADNKQPQAFRYTNPITRDAAISMRDHFIIKVDKKWYAVGTSNPIWTGPNPGVRLLVSDDMLNWKQHSWLIDASKLPADSPYNGRFWAPEIHFIQNTYWLTVNSGKVTDEDPKGMKTHSIWLFSAEKVTGPYTLVNGPLTPQYNNDATLFEDDDGQTYLYSSGNGLFQGKIDLPSGKVMGKFEKILDKQSPGNPDWMIGGIEGPFVIKKEGTYFMFFSSWTRGYEVGLLKSKSPLGVGVARADFWYTQKRLSPGIGGSRRLRPFEVSGFTRPLLRNRSQRSIHRPGRKALEFRALPYV